MGKQSIRVEEILKEMAMPYANNDLVRQMIAYRDIPKAITSLNQEYLKIIEEVVEDAVEPCEPDCSDVRHAYHQAQWDMRERLLAKFREVLNG